MVPRRGEMSLIATEAAHLERYFAVEDDAHGPRTLHILVPADPVTHVLYVHDGQNLFDPEAMWGGWRVQDSAPAGLLVVDINNTPARFEEYTHVTEPDAEHNEAAWADRVGMPMEIFVGL